jgi:hypothetical protein
MPLLNAAREVVFILQHTVHATGCEVERILEYMQSEESARAPASVLDRAQRITEGDRVFDKQIADLRIVFHQPLASSATCVGRS